MEMTGQEPVIAMQGRRLRDLRVESGGVGEEVGAEVEERRGAEEGGGDEFEEDGEVEVKVKVMVVEVEVEGGGDDRDGEAGARDVTKENEKPGSEEGAKKRDGDEKEVREEALARITRMAVREPHD